jgi:hypothetical protein
VEDDLLANKAKKLRIVTEIKDVVESQKPVENNFGQNKWILSLRKNENYKDLYSKYSFINVGRDTRPVYTMFNESKLKSPEFISSPFNNTTLPKLESVSKMKIYNGSKERFNISLEQRFNHNDLKVKRDLIIDRRKELIERRSVLYKENARKEDFESKKIQ